MKQKINIIWCKKNLRVYDNEILANIQSDVPTYDAKLGFKKLEEYFNIQKISAHEETGNWETYQRDKNILRYCKSSAIGFVEYPSNGIVRRLQSRDNWNKIWMQRMSTNIFEAKGVENTIEIPEELCTISKNTKKKYQELYNISKPFESQSWCSRLSPYITYGCLSIKMIVQATENRRQELKEI